MDITKTEVNNAVAIPLSKLKILKLIGLCILFIGVGAWLLWYKPVQVRNPFFSNPVIVMGSAIAAILLGIVGICFYLYKLTDKKPGLIVDKTGITDNSSGIAIGFIPWQDINLVYEKSVYRKKFIMIALHNPQAYIDKEPKALKRKIMQWNYSYYGSPIFIQENTLSMDYDDVINLITTQLGVYKQSAL